MSRNVKRLLAALLIFWLAAEPVCVSPLVSYADEVTEVSGTVSETASDSNAEEDIPGEEDLENDLEDDLEDDLKNDLEDDWKTEDEALASASDAQAPEKNEIRLLAANSLENEAKINDTEYETLQKAIDEAVTGDTVMLLKDCELTDTLVIEESITLDGQGHTISGDVGSTESAKKSFIKVNKVTGWFTMTDCVIAPSAPVHANAAVYLEVSGQVEITGCTFGTETGNEDVMYNGLEFSQDELYAMEYGTSISGNTFYGNSFRHNCISFYQMEDDAVIDISDNQFLELDRNTTNGIRISNYSSAPAIINMADNVYTLAEGEGSCEWAGLILFQNNKGNCGDLTVNISELSVNGTVVTENGAGTENQVYYAYPADSKMPIVEFGEGIASVNGVAYGTLEWAFDQAKDGDTITLLGNMTRSKGIPIKDGRSLTLDLRGHDVGFAAGQGFRISNGSLELTGRGRVYEQEPNYGPVILNINRTGAVKNFCSVTVGEEVTLEGWAPIFINQTDSEIFGADKAEVNVTVKGTLTSVRDTGGSTGSGIYINGVITTPNPVPQIVVDGNAEITSEGLGIYAAGCADITVGGNAGITGVEGGIEIRAGRLTVKDNAEITGTSKPSESDGNGSGSTTRGAGIAIAQHTTKLPVEVTISGGTVSGYTPVYESNPQNNDEAAVKQVSLKIDGGTFEVTGGGVQPVYSEDCRGFITGGSYSLMPETSYVADGYMRVNATADNRYYTVAPYQFAFAEGTKTAVTLDTADAAKKTYRFEMMADYEDYEVVSSQPDVAKVTTAADDKHAYTIEAVAAGTAQITAKKKNADGTVSVLTIDVIVQVNGADLSVSGGAVALDTSDVKAEAPAQPEGVTQEQFAQIVAASESKTEAAKASIAGNTAVTGAETGGFDQIENLDELQAAIPAGVEVEVYPKQKLEEIHTDLESTTTVDAAGNTVTNYTPVISKVVYDISAYMKVKGSATETKLDGVKGVFRFRIPVPTGISASARYAIVEHEGDARKSYPIEGTDPARYISVTARHFSPFILTFSKTGLNTGGSSGGSGGGSGHAVSAAAYTWHQDAKGWWIRKADGTFPANCWYQAVWNGQAQWYHFDAEGYMQTGWFTDTDGRRYYLHPVSDGTQGHMYTGWHFIDGAWYYFRPEVGGPQGSLLTNGRTPDGYTVNEAGARVES